MSAQVPSRSEADLDEDERRQLVEALAELRAAAMAYESFVGAELRRGEPAPVFDADAMRDTQERVEEAEERLWQLRERLLAQTRPSWAPRASLVTDWFSDEDADYDQVTDPVRS